MSRQRGYTQTVTFGAATLCVTEADWEESVEKIDVTGTCDGGIAGLIAGYVEGGATITGVVESSNLVHTGAAGVFAGAKGTLTITVGGAAPFTIPILVLRLKHSFRMKTAVTFTFEAALDGLAGIYTRATDSP